jgi:branched-subunit amino acid transport protein AzlD
MRDTFLAGFFLVALSAWRRNHRLAAVAATGVGVWLIRYFDPLRHWLRHLGADSFSEAQKFSWKEAWFFLESLRSVFEPISLHKWLESIGIALACVLLVVIGLKWILRHLSLSGITRLTYSAKRRLCLDYAIAGLAALCLVIPLVHMMRGAWGSFESNSRVYNGVKRNFADNARHLSVTPTGTKPLRVVVYIGESTSALNWGLYGYPVPTTPRLRAFAHEHHGFLKFSHVVSTHTHLAQSPGSTELRPTGPIFLPHDHAPKTCVIGGLAKASQHPNFGYEQPGRFRHLESGQLDYFFESHMARVCQSGICLSR